jgi:hypothetical protein
VTTKKKIKVRNRRRKERRKKKGGLENINLNLGGGGSKNVFILFTLFWGEKGHNKNSEAVLNSDLLINQLYTNVFLRTFSYASIYLFYSPVRQQARSPIFRFQTPPPALHFACKRTVGLMKNTIHVVIAFSYPSTGYFLSDTSGYQAGPSRTKQDQAGPCDNQLENDTPI